MDVLITNTDTSLLTWQLLMLFSIGLWVYCLIDILKNRFEQNDKLIWLLVVFLVPFLGSLLYLFIGKNKKINLSKR